MTTAEGHRHFAEEFFRLDREAKTEERKRNENPTNRSLESLVATLAKLEDEIRKYLEQSEPSEPATPGPDGRR